MAICVWNYFAILCAFRFTPCCLCFLGLCRGFLELGLISELVSSPKPGARNISTIAGQYDNLNCLYFMPPLGSFWANQIRSRADLRVPEEAFVVGLRFGLRYENNTVTLTMMEEARKYEPVVCGTINTTFKSPPYFVLNLYGKVKAAKLRLMEE